MAFRNNAQLFNNTTTGREDEKLCEQAALFATNSTRPSNTRVYSTPQRRWFKFAKQRGIPVLPMSATELCLWCTDLAATCSYATIRAYLSALSKFAIENGYEGISCKDSLLATVLSGIEASKKAVKKQKPLRQPITCSLLAQLKVYIDRNTHDGRMFWAIMTLATLGLFRAGELVLPREFNLESKKLLRPDNVTFEKTQSGVVMHVTIFQSKTDNSNAGSTVSVGATGKSVCAVEAMLTYIKHFPDKLENPHKALFVRENGYVVRREDLGMFMTALTKSAGLDETTFSGHAFRIGGAVDMANNGFSHREIQNAGRWKALCSKKYMRFAHMIHIKRAQAMTADL